MQRGSSIPTSVHFLLPVSFSRVRQVVPQGRCKRHRTVAQTAVCHDQSWAVKT